MKNLRTGPSFSYFALSSVVALGLAFAACENGTTLAPYGTQVLEALHAVPKAALAAAQAGRIETTLYSESSSDPFLDQTYVLQGEKQFELAVLNTAPVEANELVLNASKNQLEIERANDLHETQLVVQVKDLAKLHSLKVNGQSIAASDFHLGAPAICEGEILQSGARLPGAYALISLGALPAGADTPVALEVEGDCGVMVHVDTFGQAVCKKILVTGPTHGTTVVVRNQACASPSPSPTPSPSATPHPTPTPCPTPTPTPCPTPTPTPCPTPTPSPTPCPTPTPRPTPCPTPTPRPTPCPTPTPRPTPCPTPVPSPCAKPKQHR